jgi:hypothetical protein
VLAGYKCITLCYFEKFQGPISWTHSPHTLPSTHYIQRKSTCSECWGWTAKNGCCCWKEISAGEQGTQAYGIREIETLALAD